MNEPLTDEILCPGCGHDIDSHGILYGSPCVIRPCTCFKQPSDIARALLAAPPSDAEVEAAARSLRDSFPGFRRGARAALSAAAKVRAEA